VDAERPDGEDVLASVDRVPSGIGTRAGTAPPRAVTTADLARFAETFADLTDSEVMRRAWD